LTDIESRLERIDMTHYENCVYHVIKRFNERFVKEDFDYRDKRRGVVNFTKEVCASIVNAPNIGKEVSGGKGNRKIYKIKYMKKTKPVYVVWDTKMMVPVTVLTHDMIK